MIIQSVDGRALHWTILIDFNHEDTNGAKKQGNISYCEIVYGYDNFDICPAQLTFRDCGNPEKIIKEKPHKRKLFKLNQGLVAWNLGHCIIKLRFMFFNWYISNVL